jgi:solute carrier family 44 protein 1 (choline transporter-like protein)
MGISASRENRQLPPPEDIGDFRKFAGPTDQYVIPEVPEKRRTTDLKFTIIFAVCLLILVPFLIYTFVYADLNRFIRGYDKCGNICGQRNSPVNDIFCSGQDKTDKPFLRYKKEYTDLVVQDECVSHCESDYQEILNRCLPKSSHESSSKEFSIFFSDVIHDINRSAGYIVGLCFIGFGFCIGMLCLFRYFVTVVVWTILVGSVLAIVALTGFFWYLSTTATGSETDPMYYVSIVFTIASIFVIIMLICMFKRIKLVIRLFKESIKIIFGIPLILFEPLLTFLATLILLLIFGFFFITLSTSGVLQQVTGDLYDYFPNHAMLFTIFFHCVICIWVFQLIIGCQQMVIAGAVSAYYFARDKSAVAAPIYNSFYNLIRYHLGTVVFGSLIITIICLIKALIRGLVNNRQAKLLIDCCLGAIEDFLKYLSKNAYIQTAMHGQPFYKSGKRAVRLLAANALSAIAINSVGDFVLAMAKILVIAATLLVGVLMNDSTITHFWAAILISVIFTAVIADCFFTVFETTIDTLFLCFCEDSCINDGMERPYYMSVNLMQYMEEAQKTTKESH